MAGPIRYPVRSDAIREIQEEIARSKASWSRIEVLKPIYIDLKYYEAIKPAKKTRS